MPSEFPLSPKLLKGAFVVYDSHTPGSKAKVIAFQYNPDQVSRSLSQGRAPRESASTSRGEAQQDTFRIEGAPRETINISVTLNAADQLEEPEKNKSIVENGLHPVLATLEMLLYPTSDEVVQSEERAEQGEVQLNPADLPLTVLVWGKARVVPVLITNFSVTEEAFDTRLNPIEVKIELGLSVLNDTDLPADSMGQDIYRAYQEQKESLAQKYQAGEHEEQITGLLPS
ncbi:MAG: hypothetical protein PVH85_07895 [Desulfobacterales bacterium]|jgi:hypothetical protein